MLSDSISVLKVVSGLMIGRTLIRFFPLMTFTVLPGLWMVEGDRVSFLSSCSSMLIATATEPYCWDED